MRTLSLAIAATLLATTAASAQVAKPPTPPAAPPTPQQAADTALQEFLDSFKALGQTADSADAIAKGVQASLTQMSMTPAVKDVATKASNWVAAVNRAAEAQHKTDQAATASVQKAADARVAELTKKLDAAEAQHKTDQVNLANAQQTIANMAKHPPCVMVPDLHVGHSPPLPHSVPTQHR